MKEMEQMMNTERTRSLLEVSQLKEALLKKKRSYFTQTVNTTTEEEKVPDTTKLFPSINATPIKVVDSPIKEKGETSTTGLSEMISNLSNAVNELESQVQFFNLFYVWYKHNYCCLQYFITINSSPRHCFLITVYYE